MSIIIELWQFLKIRKKLWMAPIIAVLLLIGALVIIAEGSVLGPFIYTVF